MVKWEEEDWYCSRCSQSSSSSPQEDQRRDCKCLRWMLIVFLYSKGYAFLLYLEELSVQKLIGACYRQDDKLYLCVSSPTIKDKPVSARISDCPRRKIFAFPIANGNYIMYVDSLNVRSRGSTDPRGIFVVRFNAFKRFSVAKRSGSFCAGFF